MTDADFQRDVLQRLARIETHFEDLRCPEHQTQIADLHDRLNNVERNASFHAGKLTGLFAAASLVGGLVAKLVTVFGK